MKAVILSRASVEEAIKALRMMYHVEVAEALGHLASDRVQAIVLAEHEVRQQPSAVMMKLVYRYIVRLPDATAALSKDGRRWKYVELPHLAVATKDDVPRSQYEFGVIQTDEPIPDFGLRGFIEA